MPCLAGLIVFCTENPEGTQVTLAGDPPPHPFPTVLPHPAPLFKGRIGRTAKESTPDFPQEFRAAPGSPNVLLIMTDDVGFAGSDVFGGPVPTPTFARLAREGLRYNHFHTTAICSTTRAALITGRNHHRCAAGVLAEMGTGYPGYHSLIPKSCGTLAETLKQNGYNTSWFGKNHNVPDWHGSVAGPFDLWPTGMGYEYFYGFIGGVVNHWAPAIHENTTPIEPALKKHDYHFERDMADKAIAWIRKQNAIAPDKPFFAYYAPGSAHAPHHAPKEWITKFSGQFDDGWDKLRETVFARQRQLGVIPADAQLTARPESIPAWDSLSAKEQKVYARMMEVFAASLAFCDYQIGRVIKAVDETGERDNTLIIYIQGDNGSSGEGGLTGTINEMQFFNGIEENLDDIVSEIDDIGGPKTYNNYPAGWAHATNTPFQWTKQISSHFGGTRNGMVISWPNRIKDSGGLRTQFHHVIDIAPTVLEAALISPPAIINGVAQTPMDGVSMLYSLNEPEAASTRTKQYFESLGNRAIYQDGWIAGTTPKNLPWSSFAGEWDVADDYDWELYHIAEDFSQSVNLAKSHPKKLRQMQDLFWAEAASNNVLPLDDSRTDRMDVSIRPSLTRGRDDFTFYDGMTRIPEGSAPDSKNRSFSLTAELELDEDMTNGMIITQGGYFGGWGLYMRNGTLVYHYNLASAAHDEVVSLSKLGAGKYRVVFQFEYDGGGDGKGGLGTLFVNGKVVGSGRIHRTLPNRISDFGTLDVGRDTGTGVSDDYSVPFEFGGKLNRVILKLE